MGSLATFEVGNYEIFKKRIGKGAFSVVYKGYNKITNELVAIKEISLDTLNKYEKSIKRETEIMKKLNHPYVIKLYDTVIDEETENVYLIMQYYERGDLGKYLNKRPLKEKYALKYLKQISEAIKYLVDSNILHRDLKPNNILISDTGNIVITDFGFARYLDNDILLQTICGSPLYMAPEIIKNKKYDYKSDLWSIGIIFYEMLFGIPPFKAKNIYELIRKIENDDIKIPKKFKLSFECEELLISLLKKNPVDRISYDEFFNHSLIKNIDPFEEENKLMEISNLNNFPLIPNKINKFNNNYNIKKIKNNINLKRTIEKSTNNINNSNNLYLNYKNNLSSSDIFDKNLFKSDIQISNVDIDSKLGNKEIGKLSNCSNENNIITSNIDSTFYENEKQNEDNDYDLNLEFNFNLNNSSEVIESNNSNYFNLQIEEDYFRTSIKNNNSLLNNSLLNDYVIITSKNNNLQKNNHIKGYISKSLFFLKESYKFFSNYNSI